MKDTDLRKRVSYILKHNSFLQRVYVVLMSLFMRFISIFFRTDDYLILFVSFSGKKFGDSPKVIYDEMRAMPIFNKYKLIWAFEKPDEFEMVNSIKIDTLEYFITALKAKYWITDTNIERGLQFKKKQTVYLNTWHGTAIKKVGNDCGKRRDYNFENIDYFTVQGKYDEKIYGRTFNVKKQSFLECGLPRNDILWRADSETYRIIREKLGISEEKIAILFAPTWRDSKDNGKTYQLNMPIKIEKWKQMLGEKYIVLFRAHILTTNVLDICKDDFLVDVSNYENVNDLMIASDILVTDYSSIAFDYSILNRPILCYTFDYSEYSKYPGLYFDMDEVMPSGITKCEEELLNKVVSLNYPEECERTKKFREEFVNYGGNATEICIRKLLGIS